MPICFGGCCIPDSAIWPVVLILLMPVWNWIKQVLGFDKNEKTSSSGGCAPGECTSGCCDSGKVKDSGCTSGCCAPGDTGCTSGCCAPGDSSIPCGNKAFDLSKGMDFNKVISNKDFTVIKFTATWCGPCKKVAPTFDDLAVSQDYKNCTFVSVDIDEFEEISNKYRVTSIPYFVGIKGGQEVQAVQTANKEKLIDWCRTLVAS
jgi:thioredoxin 1